MGEPRRLGKSSSAEHRPLFRAINTVFGRIYSEVSFVTHPCSEQKLIGPRTMADTVPFVAPGYYRHAHAKERDTYGSDVLHTPIPALLFDRDLCDGIMLNSYSKSLEGFSALPPGTSATESSALVSYPSTTHAQIPTSACATVSPQVLTMPTGSLSEFRREDLKIQKQRHFHKTESNSYAVQLQAGGTPSKAWDIRMYLTNSDRHGPRLCVIICLDSGHPYRFPPKPPIGRQKPTQRYHCSNDTLHARSLMDVAEKRYSYTCYIERTHLSSRDRKVLGCALDRIGDGDFAGADIQPWKNFKAACQDWAKSGKWKETKYINRMEETWDTRRFKRVARG